MDGTSARAVLGLCSDASRQDIKNAYRRHVKTAHPDRGGDSADFARLTAAYDVALAGARVRRSSHPFVVAMAERPSKRRSFAEELTLAMGH